MPKLTKKQKDFADKLLETGDQRQAYIEAYDTNGNIQTVDPEASKTTRKPQVQAYLDQQVSMAKNIIADLAQNASNEAVRLQAAKDMIDRAEGKPIQRNMNANADSDKTYSWAE